MRGSRHHLRNAGLQPNVTNEVELLIVQPVGALHPGGKAGHDELQLAKRQLCLHQAEVSYELPGHILNGLVAGSALAAAAQLCDDFLHVIATELRIGNIEFPIQQ